MTITYVGVGTAVASSGGATGSLTPTLPSNLQVGDLVLIFCSGRNIGYVFTSPGYTERWSLDHSSSGINTIVLLYRFYQAGDGNPVVSWTGGATNATVIMQICAFRGVDSTTPFDIQGATSSNPSQANIGPITGITTGVNGKCTIVFGHRADDWTSVATLTGDGLTWNEIGEPDSTAGTDAGMVWDYAIHGGNQSITAKTFTVTAGAANYGMGVMQSLNESAITETIMSKTFPMLYLESPIKAKELKSEVSGATITKVAKDFPETLIRNGKAKELRSKWS